MENQNANPDKTGKKKFNLFDFLFGWMKPTPKEEPIKTQNEDGSPRDPAEIEADEAMRRQKAKANPKKSKAWIWALPGIIVLIALILALIFAQPSSKETGKEKPKTEQTKPGGNTQPGGGNTQPGGGNTQPGGGNTQPGGGNTQPGGGNTQPGGGNTQPGSQITFTYDQSFDFSKMDQSTKDDLKQWETTGTINVDTDEIILKTEVKNYNGKTMVWLQIEGSKGKVKNIFTEPSNIKISL